MNRIINTITSYTVYKLIQEASKKEKSVLHLLESFSRECEELGGNKELFLRLSVRELAACRLINEQEGGIAAPVIANSIGGGGVSGFKPEEIGIPPETQKRHTQKNMIFKRKKPNKYYNDETGNY